MNDGTPIASIAEVAALIGDPARANMLYALKDDGRVSAGDLACAAGVAPSTGSEHLAKLTDAGMVRVIADGRRRYYSLGHPYVTEILESVAGLAQTLTKCRPVPLPPDQGLVHARSCLDHLAGSLGSRLAGAAFQKELVTYCADGPHLTERGAAWLATFDIDAAELRAAPRRFIRLCPDWLEEHPHIGGSVGAAILRGMVGFGWLRRERGSPRVMVTPKGVSCFRAQLDLEMRSTDG